MLMNINLDMFQAAAVGSVVTVYLYLTDILDIVSLVHLHDALDNLLSQSLVPLVHTVLCDIDGRNEFDAIW